MSEILINGPWNSEPDGPMVKCEICGAEGPANWHHPPQLCAQRQVANHEAKMHDAVERRQLTLARGLAAVLVAMAAGKRPHPGVLVAIVAEWSNALLQGADPAQGADPK